MVHNHNRIKIFTCTSTCTSYDSYIYRHYIKISITAKYIQSVPDMILPPYSIRHNDQSEPGMIASNNVVQNDTTTANRIMAHPGT